MSRTGKDALTHTQATLALKAAAQAIAETDGLVLAVLMVRIGEDGKPLIFAPTIHPENFSAECVADIAEVYAHSARRIADEKIVVPDSGSVKLTVNVLDVPECQPSPINPLHVHRPGRGKATVN